MARNFFLKIKMYGFFALYFISDILILIGVLVMRATSDPAYFGMKIAADNSPVLWALPTVFVVQHLIVFWGFFSVSRKEDKYMLYPKDESGDRTYHYFTPQQLLIFIEISSKNINGKDNDYDKIFVTNEPKPTMFSYRLFGKKTIVLHPTILQVAETQELRAGLVIDLELASKASIIRIYASQHQKFFFIPFIGPLLYFIREIAILVFFFSSNSGGNPLRLALLMLFLIVIFFLIMTVLSKILSGFINTANRNYIIHADLQAAELVGARAVINYLLKLGHRQEAIEVILDEIQYLEELEKGKIIESLEKTRILKLVQKFPIASIDRDLALEMAPEIFITQKIDILESIYHCEFPNREEIIKNSVEQLLQERRKFINEWKAKYDKPGSDMQIPSSVDLQINIDKCINIESFDMKSSLVDEEIEVLIQEINKKPKRNLFVHEPAKTSKFSRQPSTADQILAVNKIEFRG